MPIDSQIRQIIKANGHISIDDMMKEVLTINKAAYYQRIQNIGEAGDFITSPEISQLFGEIIALWVIEQWEKLNKPKDFVLFELGPGQGTLMKDMLRVAKLVPAFFSAINIHLLEINPYFIEKQKHLSLSGKEITWHSEVNTVPKLPMIIVANEFFDALPIKQYIKSNKIWKEIVLIADPAAGQLKLRHIPVLDRLAKQLLIDHPNASDGAVIEESVESMNIMRFIGKRLKQHGGSALIIDYGYDILPNSRATTQYNATLQAVKNHEYQSIISSLGEADLTAHVDFYALKTSIQEQGVDSKNMHISTQRDFLINYGILERLKNLKSKVTINESIILDKQVDRLIAQDQMGELFRVMQAHIVK